MLTLLKTAWSFLSGGSILEILAGGAFLFVIGFAAGQHSVTKQAVQSAVETVQTHADKEFAAATGAMAQANKDSQAHVDKAAHQARVADDQVHEDLKREADAATTTAAAARAQLVKERADHDRQMAEARSATADAPAFQMPDVNDPRCGWGADVRRLLDDASGATATTATGPRAGLDGAGGIAGPDPAPAKAADLRSRSTEGLGLSCAELVQGYIDLGSYARAQYGFGTAWQDAYRLAIMPGETP